MAVDERRKLVTISVPVYNEEANIARLLERLRAFAAATPAYDFEFLFTDNASIDDTYRRIAEEAAKDPRVRVARFSRNFGYQRSILTNFLLAHGDAAVQVDADLQDPPEMITEFLSYWEQGYKVVYGIRKKREESFVLEGVRKLYYRLIRRISDVDLPKDAGDFRLIDRVIIEHLRTIDDKNPYLRGLIASLGYRQRGIKYSRAPRMAGSTKFNFLRLVRLGIDGIVSQSTAPLQYITMFGFVLSALSVVTAVAYLIYWILNADKVAPGFTTIALLQLMSLGMNAAFLGVLGEYLARVSENVRGHPFTVIDRTIENGIEKVEEAVFEPGRQHK